ncbi:MAG: 3-oxoacyl-ACP synthase [Acidimicrobiaceae bacterium]|jgi:3-oxoacyl-[acyl-carrier-protein] synthase-3|nr:3-oxoacyl-ACP synthase [Acidimicrobiaceae bacterium]|tara:strand:- start:29 stop:985 length:957 start_codon:yes stop_codon:yes gene_type:complete
MNPLPEAHLGMRISGWGVALPERVVTNDELSQTLDTSNEWILERSGIAERRIGGSTGSLAVEAGKAALASAGVSADSIDLLIIATTTPDDQIPATSSKVQHELGLSCGAMDINAACSGFVYSLVTGSSFLQAGCKRVLVIGSETLSRFTNWEDRSTAILFGDGAGAVIIEPSENGGKLLGWDLSSSGELRDILHAVIGGTLYMAGSEVFRKAVIAMTESGKKAIANAGVSPDEISLVVPHQANIRIIETSMKKLGIPLERAVWVGDKTANTSAASIPIALGHALDNNKVAANDLILLVGFGAGMTAASAVIQWGEING